LVLCPGFKRQRGQKMQSARELVNRVFEKPPYIIEEGILNENSIMVIGGPPKAYKSFFSQTIALNLATGTNLFGAHRVKNRVQHLAFNVIEPKRVLMLEQEIGDWSLKDRLSSMSLAQEEPRRSLFLDNLFTHSCDRDLRLDNKQGVEAISVLVEKVKPHVLILDPLIEFHQLDENSSQHMISVMRNLDKIRDQHKCAIIMNHHASKSDERHGPDALRGSSALYGKGDSFFMLNVINRDAGIIEVEVIIRRDKPIHPFRVKIDWLDLTCKFHEWVTSKSEKKKKSGGTPYDEYIV
jgi:RecA-family ATPase